MNILIKNEINLNIQVRINSYRHETPIFIALESKGKDYENFVRIVQSSYRQCICMLTWQP